LELAGSSAEQSPVKTTKKKIAKKKNKNKK
jgi:hypothetical protein